MSKNRKSKQAPKVLKVLKEADVDQAVEQWGFNCGPGALCAATGLSPIEVRPHLGDFEALGYMDDGMMAQALRSIGVVYERIFEHRGCGEPKEQGFEFPSLGLVRIQWDGPWCAPGEILETRLRHSHWIATRLPQHKWSKYPKETIEVFDVNAVGADPERGGWMPMGAWKEHLVPWLIEACEPEGTGKWWPTHCWELMAVLM